MPTTGADRAEAAFWATYLRNRNVDVATANDGAASVAGGYAIYAAGSALGTALAVGSTHALTDDDVAVLDAFYGRRGAPVRVEMRESSVERDRALLDRHGFTREHAAYAIYETTGMPDGDDDVAVHAERDRSSWVRLVATAFADGAAPDPVRVRSIELCAAAAANVFIAHAGGVPAGGGALGISGEFALLYCGAVLPAFRRRGIHGALLRARIAAARARGFARAAIKVESGSDAERAVHAAGFERTVRTLRLGRSSEPSPRA
jgi:[ribosomal protein S18]-alanine N-acetyltransferase